MNLVGYFDSAFGLGEAARAMLAAIETGTTPVVPVSIRSASGQQRDPGLATVGPDAAPFAVNLLYLNGDGTRGFLREQPAFCTGRYSIGVWWWEVVPAPGSWSRVSRRLDELWVCSDHVRDALAPIAEAPITKVPQPVPFPAAGRQTRTRLGLPDEFVFYSMFDYSSTFGRKNPLGLVKAFRQAFSDGSGPHLLIRSINGRRHPHHRRLLEDAAEGRRDIHVVDRYVTEEVKNAMLSHCSCYVSLHRAEGFGLPLAEAMRLGKPVIATGWSGNREFMTEENSYLVDFTMTTVGYGSWPYPPKGHWADPDLDHASSLMREVFKDREAAAERGRWAAQDLRRHDPTTVAIAIKDRLELVRHHMGASPSDSPAEVPACRA